MSATAAADRAQTFWNCPQLAYAPSQGGRARKTLSVGCLEGKSSLIPRCDDSIREATQGKCVYMGHSQASCHPVHQPGVVLVSPKNLDGSPNETSVTMAFAKHSWPATGPNILLPGRQDSRSMISQRSSPPLQLQPLLTLLTEPRKLPPSEPDPKQQAAAGKEGSTCPADSDSDAFSFKGASIHLQRTRCASL